MAEETDPNATNPSPKSLVVTVPANAMAAMSATGTGNGTIVTPAGYPNIRLKVIEPLTIVAVRCLRTFIQTMLGILMAGPATGLIPARDFGHLLAMSASLAVGAAVISVLQNAAELLGKIDQKFPSFTA